MCDGCLPAFSGKPTYWFAGDNHDDDDGDVLIESEVLFFILRAFRMLRPEVIWICEETHIRWHTQEKGVNVRVLWSNLVLIARMAILGRGYLHMLYFRINATMVCDPAWLKEEQPRMYKKYILLCFAHSAFSWPVLFSLTTTKNRIKTHQISEENGCSFLKYGNCMIRE